MIIDDFGALPTFFGDYVFEDEIARGGMKLVVRAYCRTTKKVVAVALLKARFPTEELKARFAREIAALEILSHPHIVPMIDHGCLDGQLYFVMQLIEGNSLGGVIPAQGFTLPEMCDLTIPIAEALEHAHHCGIYHRDLKPENILLEAEEVPRLIDFGLGKYDRQNRKLTRQGQGLGTRPYVSPEQLRGETVGQASDIYSLAVVMLEMLLGRETFIERLRACGDSPPAAMPLAGRLLDDPAVLSKISGEARRVLGRSLQVDPAARYPGMSQLLVDLRELRLPATNGHHRDSAESEPERNGVVPVDAAVIEDPARPKTIGTGSVIAGRYNLQALLRLGPMGEVWKAEVPHRSHPVVIKFLPHTLRSNPKEMRQLRESFDLVESLNHGSICPVYDLDEDPVAGIFLVMKFIPGIDLDQLCQRRRASGEMFSLAEVVRILYPIAQAIDHAHAKGVIHRDIKPDNIMANAEGDDYFLIDFGIAERIRQTMSRIEVLPEPAGTIHYLAPEVWQGQSPDERSDQYALGAVAYKLLAGDPPFSTAHSTQVLSHCAIHEPITALNLNPAVNQVFSQVLSKVPTERFGKCTEFIEALRRCESGIPGPAVSSRPTGPGPAVTVPAFLGTTLLTLAIAWLLLGNSFTPADWIAQAFSGPELPDAAVPDSRLPEEDAPPSQPTGSNPSEPREDQPLNNPPPGNSTPADSPPQSEAERSFARGMDRLEQGDFLAAIQSFEQAVRHQPEHQAALLQRAHALRRQGESIESQQGTEAAAEYFQRAADNYTLVLEGQPQEIEALVGRGMAKQHLGLASEAIFDFTSALEIDQFLAEAYEYRGEAYFARRDFQRAEADFLRLLFLDDTRTDVQRKIDQCQQKESPP